MAVVALAERVRIGEACDPVFAFVRSGTVLDDTSEVVWNRYMKKVYGQSPALKQFLEQERDRYTLELIDRLDPALAARVRKEMAA